MEEIRKEVYLLPDTIKKLKLRAVHANAKSLKAYMEKVLIKDADKLDSKK